MTDEPVLRVERDPDDAFVTLIMNRPEKLNALDLELLEALDTAVRDAQRDPDIRAIILTGAGRAFTTGFDLVSDDFEMDTEA
ncbi:MAG: enoyl-CoA hydratase-related protein, partial [Alphaproteobacteria bacterium]